MARLCPPVKIIEESVQHPCDDAKGATEALAAKFDISARVYCTTGGATPTPHCGMVARELVLWNKEPYEGEEEGMCTWTASLRVVCGGVDRRRWWHIFGDAIAKAFGIVIAAVILVYGLPIALGLGTKAARDPVVRGEIIQFAKAMAKKAA